MLTRRASRASHTLMAIAFTLFLGGCAAEKKPVIAPRAELEPVSQTTVTSAEVAHQQQRQISPTISVSADIALACKLQLNDLATTPKFDFDQSDLLVADLVALEQTADCLTYGPLKGRSIKLIGRADPRGPTEYNMALGARRAGSVGAYLARLGVGMTHMFVTSRGELDAVGIDEMGWQIDRRVDIVLVLEE